MLLKVCAVKDSAADAFGRPFFVPTIGLAMRSFIDEVNNRESPFNAHPDDYTLYEIGEFDDNVGSLVSWDVPRLVMRGKEALISAE